MPPAALPMAVSISLSRCRRRRDIPTYTQFTPLTGQPVSSNVDRVDAGIDAGGTVTFSATGNVQVADDAAAGTNASVRRHQEALCDDDDGTQIYPRADPTSANPANPDQQYRDAERFAL